MVEGELTLAPGVSTLDARAPSRTRHARSDSGLALYARRPGWTMCEPPPSTSVAPASRGCIETRRPSAPNLAAAVSVVTRAFSRAVDRALTGAVMYAPGPSHRAWEEDRAGGLPEGGSLECGTRPVLFA